MRTFVAIVVDQLSWTDSASLSCTNQLLGQPQPVELAYFPTVTETAHATLSSGSLPSQHGVIGSEAFVRDPRDPNSLSIRRISERVFDPSGLGVGVPLSHYLANLGIQCISVAGKLKVAQLLDPRPGIRVGPEMAVRATLEKAGASEPFTIEAIDADGLPINSIHDRQGPLALSDAGTNALLLSVALDLLEQARDPGRSVCLFVSLPQLDALGHFALRHSESFSLALRETDEALARFLDSLPQLLGDDYRVCVTSDHGCREVDTAVWIQDGIPTMRSRNGEQKLLELPDGIRRHSASCEKPAMLFDGGTVRIMAEPGREADLAAELSDRWGEVLADTALKEELDGPQYPHRCKHDNWGDVIGFAKKNVALCKPEWIKGTSIPVGEHGTLFSSDRIVPWWGPLTSHHVLREKIAAYLMRTSSALPNTAQEGLGAL